MTAKKVLKNKKSPQFIKNEVIFYVVLITFMLQRGAQH